MPQIGAMQRRQSDQQHRRADFSAARQEAFGRVLDDRPPFALQRQEEELVGGACHGVPRGRLPETRQDRRPDRRQHQPRDRPGDDAPGQHEGEQPRTDAGEQEARHELRGQGQQAHRDVEQAEPPSEFGGIGRLHLQRELELVVDDAAGDGAEQDDQRQQTRIAVLAEHGQGPQWRRLDLLDGLGGAQRLRRERQRQCPGAKMHDGGQAEPPAR